jgi:hypothetical protein
MSSIGAESDGRLWPDNYLDTLVNDLIATAFYNPELAGLKFAALARYAVLLRFQNDFNNNIVLSMMALDSVLQSALTQVGCQRSDFAILRNCSSEPQAKGLGALHNNYVRKPKKHIR